MNLWVKKSNQLKGSEKKMNEKYFKDSSLAFAITIGFPWFLADAVCATSFKYYIVNYF